MLSKSKLIWCLPGALVLALFGVGHSQEEKLGPDPKEVQAVLDKARDFLKTQQNKDGSFAPKLGGPGVSALVVAALARNGVSSKDPLMASTLAYLEKQVKTDGGIYSKGLANYTTCVAIAAFHEVNTAGKYDTVIKNASSFIKGIQHTEKDSVAFGGFGYDAQIEARRVQHELLRRRPAGRRRLSKDDPAVQRAIKFLGRCQNLPGESNDQKFAEKAAKDDIGGLTYTPIDPDDSRHKTADGGLRSLGGMTYGGLKSFLYAGVSRDDPRVKAAVELDPPPLHAGRKPRRRPGRALLLLPHLRQGDAGPGRGPFRRPQERQARLATRAVRSPEETAKGRRQLAQRRRQDLRRIDPGAGDRLRHAEPELLHREEISFSNLRSTQRKQIKALACTACSAWKPVAISPSQAPSSEQP